MEADGFYCCTPPHLSESIIHALEMVRVEGRTASTHTPNSNFVLIIIIIFLNRVDFESKFIILFLCKYWFCVYGDNNLGFIFLFQQILQIFYYTRFSPRNRLLSTLYCSITEFDRCQCFTCPIFGFQVSIWTELVGLCWNSDSESCRNLARMSWEALPK